MAKSMFVVLALVLVAGCVADQAATAVSPVQKVLQMLEDMKSKGIAEKQAETVGFKTFMQFCKDTSAAKEKAISDATDQIEKLSADIEKNDAAALVLGKEITKLDALADEARADMAASTTEWEGDEADYKKLHASYEANIGDISLAIGQVKSMIAAENAAAASSAASLLQQTAARATFPVHAKKALEAFLATSSVLEERAPEGATYETQSGGVVELFENLKLKLEDELSDAEKKFMQSKGSYMVVQQNLHDQADEHTTLRNLKAGTKKDKEAASSAAAGDKESTVSMKAENEEALKELHAECAIKSSEYESNQKVRAGENVALNKAIEIIAGGAVSGAADKHLPAALAQTSLAQLRSVNEAVTRKPSQSAAASFLQAQGKRLNSRILAALSTRAAEDPFGKVKKMIQDMVYKLMEEANEEAEHKGFCDTEMGTNKITRDQKTTAVEELTASIEEMTAKISKLGEEIGQLSEEAAEINAAVAKASGIRQAEKAKNTETISEGYSAATAVKQALQVLKDFYESAAFVQKKAVTIAKAQQPVQSGASTGVIGMLEVILSDFERLVADTEQDEAFSQKEFEKFSTESAHESAVLKQHVKNKSELKTETHVDLAAAKKDLTSTQAELDAAVAYFEKLKPSCVEAPITYDDRVQRRKEEIESLKETLNILDQTDV